MQRRAAICTIVFLSLLSLGAGYRTRNFLVTAETDEQARQIARRAEEVRREVALHWLGQALPDWREPCLVEAVVDEGGRPGGSASFSFGAGGPFAMRIDLSGPWSELSASVLPHELSHVILACHFRRPLPRWADEGACMMLEDARRQSRHRRTVARVLNSGRGIELGRLIGLMTYPGDAAPLYSMGHSLTSFLVARGGEQTFIEFLRDGLDGEWAAAAETHYGFDSLGELQENWLDWAMPGI